MKLPAPRPSPSSRSAPRFTLALAACACALAVALATQAQAQRRIIGADSDEPTDAGPPAEAPAKDAKKDEKKDAKDAKKDAKDDKKDAKKDAKDAKKGGAKKDDKRDVLEDTAAEKSEREKAADAREAAEKKAEEAAEAEKKRQEEERRKLEEEKKAAEAKKKLENRDQQLRAAQKVRQITRTSGDFALSAAVEPGQVKKDALVEIRVAVAEKLEVADPKFGNLMPIRGADLVATVTGAGAGGKGRVVYALHPLETPGRYGFHMTPVKDGPIQISIAGTAGKKSFDATFPLHVGVWPPPDFDAEEKNNLATTDAARTGRRVLGGNE